MLRTLIRKQLLEINKSFFYDYRRNKAKSKGAIAATIALYVILMVGVLGGMFSFLAYQIAGPLSAAGFDWLYFLIMDGIAIILGIFGSVFSTYSSLFLSKDNDLLLSMPIPVNHIMTARLVGVYIVDLMYTLVVLIPMSVVYWIAVPFSVQNLIGPIILSFNTTLLVLVLSTGLGWVVARVSLKMKNKGVATALIALLGIGLYYFVYFKATAIIQQFVSNIGTMEIEIKGAIVPLYYIGKTGAGMVVPMIVVTVVVLALAAMVYLILNKTFIKLVTTKTGASKAVYKGDNSKSRSLTKALLFKEIKRFTSSSTYLLNCGIGAVVMVIAAVFILIKAEDVNHVISSLFGDGMVSAFVPIAAGAISMMLSMIYITAPSISLEGKSLWISKSLPITPKQFLRAKLMNHLLFSAVPGLILSASLIVVMKPGVVESLLLLVMTALLSLTFGLLGLVLNLKKPNLNWTSEMMVIKQGTTVFIASFSGWIYGGLIIVSGIFLTGFINPTLLMGLWVILTAILCVLMQLWINGRGVAIYEEL